MSDFYFFYNPETKLFHSRIKGIPFAFSTKELKELDSFLHEELKKEEVINKKK